MQFAAVPRWQWVALAIVVGAVIGWLRDAANGQLYGINVQGYGMLLADQQQFENGLIQEYDGIRLFSNPTVYPHWITDPKGQPKLVYIVSGQYWDGRQQVKDGKAVAEWLPRCVITQVPYKPRIAVPDAGATAGAATAEFPSVREFLDALHRQYGVSYRYAWWALHPVLIWIFGCTLVIGGVWPTLINLLTYGSFTRPKGVKAVSLWNIRPRGKPEKPKVPFAPASVDSDEVSSQSDEMIPELEEGPVAATALSSAPLELVPEAPKEQRDYGADQGDFYPTERHAHRRKPPGQ